MDICLLPAGRQRHLAYLIGSYFEFGADFFDNLRSQRKSIFTLKGRNKVLWAAMIGSLLLTTVVLEVPFIANAFGFTTIGWDEYSIALGLAVMVIPVVEIVKFVQRKIAKQ